MIVFRKLEVVARSSLRRMFRDWQAVFFVLLFPMVIVLVLGIVFGNAFDATLGVAAPPNDPLADDVFDALERNDEIDVHRYDDADALREAVEYGRVQAGAVVPEGYSDRLRAGDTAVVEFFAGPTGVGRLLQPIVLDVTSEQATRLQAARFATDHGGSDFDASLAEVDQLASDFPRVSVRTTTTGDAMFEDLESFGTFGLGASTQILLFMFVSGLASSSALIQSRALGVSRRMLATPTSARVVLLGEALGRFVVVAFQGAYIMLGTALIFGVDWGDPVGATAIVFVFALVATGAAMLAGALFSNDQQAGSIGVFIGLGFAALGGSMAPLDIFPPTMRTIAHVTPHAWANDAFGELIADHGGFVDILPELAVLSAMAVGLLAVAAWRLRRALTA